MTEVIPFRRPGATHERPRSHHNLGLAAVLEQFAGCFLAEATHREVYHQEGLSLLIVFFDHEQPVIVTSDETSQLFSVELSVGSVKPELLDQAVYLMNQVNCRTEAGHFEYIDSGIRYRHSCKALGENIAALAGNPDRLNLALVSELVQNGRAQVNEVTPLFAGVVG